MANYFLKSADATKIYRIEYSVRNGSPDVYNVGAVFCTSDNVHLPDGTIVNSVDQPVAMGNVLVDMVFANVVPATVAEYRTLAKSIIDTRW